MFSWECILHLQTTSVNLVNHCFGGQLIGCQLLRLREIHNVHKLTEIGRTRFRGCCENLRERIHENEVWVSEIRIFCIITMDTRESVHTSHLRDALCSRTKLAAIKMRSIWRLLPDHGLLCATGLKDAPLGEPEIEYCRKHVATAFLWSFHQHFWINRRRSSQLVRKTLLPWARNTHSPIKAIAVDTVCERHVCFCGGVVA